MDLTPDALADALAAHVRTEQPALPGRTNHLRAAVMLPLVWRDGPVAVATLRPPTMRKHAGEVCFPGGRRDPSDADLYAAAVREANEEVGIEGPRLLGRLSSIPLYTSDYRLEPFVTEVGDGPWTPNPAEVAEVLEISLAGLLAADRLHGIPWEYQGRLHLSPVFPLGELVMYGGTAHALYELLQVVAGASGLELPPLEPGRYRWEDLLG